MPGNTSSSLTLARSDHDYESGLSSTLGSSFSHLFFASGFWVLRVRFRVGLRSWSSAWRSPIGSLSVVWVVRLARREAASWLSIDYSRFRARFGGREDSAAVWVSRRKWRRTLSAGLSEHSPRAIVIFALIHVRSCRSLTCRARAQVETGLGLECGLRWYAFAYRSGQLGRLGF